MNSIIAQLDDVHLIYHEPRGETEAVGGISLSVHKGEFVSIVGPSGCGKTSLLSIFAGILQPSSGKAEVLGAPPDPRANSTGYMLQRDHLFDWRTIEQNALLGLEVKKRLNAETHAYAAELLDRYGLGAFKDYYPRQLSGGMKQKAALIRTLAFSPELLLLDDAPVRRHLFSYQFAVGRGHDHNLVGVHAVERIKDIAYHRLTADRHQHLRQIRLHPGAFAGTEHNGSNFRASHIFPFLIFF